MFLIFFLVGTSWAQFFKESPSLILFDESFERSSSEYVFRKQANNAIPETHFYVDNSDEFRIDSFMALENTNRRMSTSNKGKQPETSFLGFSINNNRPNTANIRKLNTATNFLNIAQGPTNYEDKSDKNVISANKDLSNIVFVGDSIPKHEITRAAEDSLEIKFEESKEIVTFTNTNTFESGSLNRNNAINSNFNQNLFIRPSGLNTNRNTNNFIPTLHRNNNFNFHRNNSNRSVPARSKLPPNANVSPNNLNRNIDIFESKFDKNRLTLKNRNNKFTSGFTTDMFTKVSRKPHFTTNSLRVDSSEDLFEDLSNDDADESVRNKLFRLGFRSKQPFREFGSNSRFNTFQAPIPFIPNGNKFGNDRSSFFSEESLEDENFNPLNHFRIQNTHSNTFKRPLQDVKLFSPGIPRYPLRQSHNTGNHIKSNNFGITLKTAAIDPFSHIKRSEFFPNIPSFNWLGGNGYYVRMSRGNSLPVSYFVKYD